jgi:hypothetical protein
MCHKVSAISGKVPKSKYEERRKERKKAIKKEIKLVPEGEDYFTK